MTSTWGKKVPFLRWSFWRMLIGMKHLLKDWQVGDGREEKAALIRRSPRAPRRSPPT